MFHITPERKDGCNLTIKLFILHTEWMARADPPKEAKTFKKMSSLSLLLSLDKITHYFKEWTTASGVLKKICSAVFTKIWCSNRSSSQNYSAPKENSSYKYSERVALWRAVLKVTLASANVYNGTASRAFSAFDILFKQNSEQLVLWNN